MLLTKKGLLCYDPVINHVRVSQNAIFLENQFFFSSHSDSLPSFSILPNFTDGVSPPPLLVYERSRHKDVPQLPASTNHSPPPDPPLEPDPSLGPSPIQLRRSTRQTHPP